MPGLPIFCVDVFTSSPFGGNPAGVVILDSVQPALWMQKVAAELNLSDTAFLVRKEAGNYDLRWFTPAIEIDLCGHATLAAAFILWEEGLEEKEEILFHTRSGPLIANRVNGGASVGFPVTEASPTQAPEGLMSSLGLPDDHQFFDGGVYGLVEIESEEAVLAIKPDFAALKKVALVGVIVTAKGASPDVDFVSRFFAPAAGIDEDPVTGSAHTRLAPYWAKRLGRKTFSAKQVSSRGGELTVRLMDGGRVEIQGKAALVWKGSLSARS